MKNKIKIIGGLSCASLFALALFGLSANPEAADAWYDNDPTSELRWVDETYEYSVSGGIKTPTRKEKVENDEKGRRYITTISTYDAGTSEYNLYRQEVITYTDQDQPLVYLEKSYNATSQQWEDTSRTDYEYDSEHRETAYYCYSYDDSVWKTTYGERNIYTNNLLTKTETLASDPSDATKFIVENYWIYAYDESGRKTDTSYYVGSDDLYIKKTYKAYTYIDQTNLVSRIDSFGYLDDGATIKSKYVEDYTYNEDGTEHEYIYSQYNISVDPYVINHQEKTEYSYVDKEVAKECTKVISNRNNVSEAWKYNSKNIFLDSEFLAYNVNYYYNSDWVLLYGAKNEILCNSQGDVVTVNDYELNSDGTTYDLDRTKTIKYLDTQEVSVNPASNLTYTGTSLELGSVTPGAEGSTITYKVNDGEYSVNKPTATNAGSYTVSYKVEKSGYRTVTGTFTVNIAKAKVELPTAKTDLTYTGNIITGVEAPLGAPYALTSNTATEAGEYTAVATLTDKANYEWNLATPTSDDQQIKWSILSAGANYTGAIIGGVVGGLAVIYIAGYFLWKYKAFAFLDKSLFTKAYSWIDKIIAKIRKK